ncbi:MAG: Bacterial transcription activator, effector binding domain [Flaviaesturariibacter sp.]|nr:Bacterial transcription activator, effector binding domain [Flaviaesturariibacter sp.]
MDIEIITAHLHLDVYGFAAIATNKDYAGTAFRLSGRMWEIVKSNGLKNKGKNIWVYEAADHVFAGIELENPSDGDNNGLEESTIRLEKYARFRHLGPYHLLKQSGQNMAIELAKQGYEVRFPCIEIYGHWTPKESELETELLMCLA